MYKFNKAMCFFLVMIFLLSMLVSCAQQEQPDATAFSIASDTKNLNIYDNSFDTTITLTGYKWNDQISIQDIILSQAFSDMTVDQVKRINDTQLKISVQGDLQKNFLAGSIEFEGNTIIDPYEQEEQAGIDSSQEKETAATETAADETSPVTYSVDIAVLQPSANIQIENTEGTVAKIKVKLTDCEFTDAASEVSFSFNDPQIPVNISAATRVDDQTMELLLASNTDKDIDTLFESIADSALLISKDAVSTGRELQAPVGSYNAGLSVSVDYVEQTGDSALVTLLISCSNGNLDGLEKDRISLDGDFGAVSSFKLMDDQSAELKVMVNKEYTDEMTVDGHVRITGQWGKNLWGSACSGADLPVHYSAQDDSKELLAVDTGMAYDLIKAGLKSIAFGIGKEAGGRLMEAMDANLFPDETVNQLSKMNDYLQKIDAKWTSIMDQVNGHLSIMQDKIGSNNCSRVLDEYDTLASTLQATVLHLNNKKAGVDAAKKNTPEYETAKAAYVAAVDKEPCKVYTNAYVLGQKILKGSAGLASGVVGSYDEMLSYLYNFDVQTYGLKEQFRVMTFALYMEAYDQAILYYELTDSNNELLKQLESQLVSINKLMDKIAVVRRTDDNVYCYAAGRTLKRFAGAVGGDGSNYRSDLTETIAENMIQRAKYRNTTLGADMDEAGFYTVNAKTYLGCDIFIVDCVNSSHRTSKKREWWTTMTEINIRTHEIKKNIRTYYQRQEYVWYNFDWKQKECWGTYSCPGFRLESA